MSHASSSPIPGLKSSVPARQNLSAAPAVNALQLQPPRLAPASSPRGGGGGDTEREFAAMQARQAAQSQAMISSRSPMASARVHSSIATSSESHDAAASPLSRKPSTTSVAAAGSSLSASAGVPASPSWKSSAAALSASPPSVAVSSSPSASSLLASRKLRSTDSKEQALDQPTPPPRARPRPQDEASLLECRRLVQRKDTYIAGLQRNCETLAALCAKHMQQVSLLKADFDRVTLEKHSLDVDSGRLASSESMVTKLVSENSDLAAQKKALQTRFETTQSKLHQCQTQLVELSEQKEDLFLSLNKERAIALSTRSELDDMKAALSDEGATVGGKASRTSAAEFEHKILSLRRECDSNRASLDGLTGAYKALQSTATKAANKAARAEQEALVLSADVTRLKAQAAVLRKEALESKNQAEDAREAHDALLAKVRALEGEHRDLSTRAPELEKALKEAQRRGDKLKREYDSAWSTGQDLRLQVEEARRETELARKQVGLLSSTQQPPTSKRASMDGEATERAQLTSQLESLQSRYEQLETLLRDAEASGSRWSSKYDAAVREKSELVTAMEQLHADNAKLQIAVNAAGATGMTDGLQQSLANSAAALDALQKSSDAQATELAALKASSATQSTELAALRAQLGSAAAAHTAALAEVTQRSEAYVASKLSASEKNAAQLQKQLIASQQRTAELEALLDQPRMSADQLSKLAKREAELQAAVAKLLVNEQASEASFTCFACVGVFTKPVTCIPCGHSYCLGCIEKSNVCQQCRPPAKVTFYANELLEELASRFIFRKQALAALEAMTAQPLTK